MVIEITYKPITYVYNSIRVWGLHHRVPHELVILFILMEKPVTTKYGIIWKTNNIIIWNPHMMLSIIVYNFFPFEGDLIEKRPYKH